MTQQEAYLKGFIDKCAQYGVDPEAVAATVPPPTQVTVNQDEPLVEKYWDDEDTAATKYPAVHQKILERKRFNGPKYNPPVQNQL